MVEAAVGKQLVKAGVVCGHAEEEGKKIR